MINDMIILIAGPSHTGKTALAQRILETYHFPYLSIDHLKMGLIRSGQTELTAMSRDEVLTSYLWPIVREMIKTAIENGQNLTIEGCYIPHDWANDFPEGYRKEIRCIRLVMSEAYIRSHFEDIKAHASTIERRLDDSYCTVESVLEANSRELEQCRRFGADYFWIDTEYNQDAMVQEIEKTLAGKCS